jgi:hypothetical protein
MIKLRHPHMALNADETDPKLKRDLGPPYRMWSTCLVPESWSPQQIVDRIAQSARAAADGKLGAVVLNSHGLFRDLIPEGSKKKKYSGGFGVGLGDGIRLADTPLFSALNGMVDEIYLSACEAARVSIAGAGGDGKMFCSAIAKHAAAYVYASDARQKTLVRMPYGYIDGYEGTVYRWGPDGTLTGSRSRWRSGPWDAARWLHAGP